MVRSLSEIQSTKYVNLSQKDSIDTEMKLQMKRVNQYYNLLKTERFLTENCMVDITDAYLNNLNSDISKNNVDKWVEVKKGFNIHISSVRNCYKSSKWRHHGFLSYFSPVDSHIFGQRACNKIIGKFDGLHTDTVYIDFTVSGSVDNRKYVYSLKSKSGKLPPLKLSAANSSLSGVPILYAEGDLDRNGTDEIAFTISCQTSQFRDYVVLTLHKKKWMMMVPQDETLLQIPSYLRKIGLEIISPSKHRGMVHINYMTDKGLNSHIEDTIVNMYLKDYRFRQ